MKIHQTISVPRLAAAVARQRRGLDNPGFCIFCGCEHEGVEPDATEYECEACGEPGVYGAEELLVLTGVC